MYSKPIIQSNLSAAQKNVNFTLREYPSDYCQTVVKHLNALLDDEGKLQRDLKPDELEFIQNERILCKYNFRYWLERYVWIKSKLGKLESDTTTTMLFPVNVAQNMILKCWAEQEEQLLPVMLMCVKARQLGMSTVVEFAIGHRFQFYPHINALIASSTENKSRKMLDWILFGLQNQPWWLLPRMSEPRTTHERFLDNIDLQSTITVQWGNKTTGIARGETPSVVHLSELTEWTANPWEVVDAALMYSFHEDPSSFMIWESTSKGMGEFNWWWKKWEYYSQEWSKGTTRMRPLFLPWYVGTDVWPTKTWVRQRRKYLDTWTPADLTVQHAASAKDYVANTPMLREQLGDDWSMPREQMLFWELERQEKKANNALQKFLEEMPATALESFQTTNMSCFDLDTIVDLENRRQQPVAIYAVTGSHIASNFAPAARQIDPEKKRIKIRCNLTGDAPLAFELIPLLLDNYMSIDPNNRLFIYEEPRPGETYHFGVDTGYGIGQDSSVINCIRKATLTNPVAAQACEFASNQMNSVDIAPICMAVGMYYSYMADGSRIMPKFSIELAVNGDSCQHNMKKWGWRKFHRWETYDKFERKVSNRMGWISSKWSRPMLVDYFNTLIRDQDVQLNSYWLINRELKNLEKDFDKQKIAAAYGAHDDRYMSLGIALFVAHAWDVRFKRGVDVFEEAEKAQQRKAIDYEKPEQANLLPVPEDDDANDAFMRNFYNELIEETLDSY